VLGRLDVDRVAALCALVRAGRSVAAGGNWLCHLALQSSWSGRAYPGSTFSTRGGPSSPIVSSVPGQ
jgi:hypothetical protein